MVRIPILMEGHFVCYSLNDDHIFHLFGDGLEHVRELRAPLKGRGGTMQEWKVLAQGGEGARISRCPCGHIHLDYGNVTLRFTEEDFRTFAAMVGRAATNLDGARLPKGLAVRPEDVAATFSEN